MFITHRADLHSPLPLSVSLMEELLHYPISPLTIQLQGFSGVTQVSTVHHVTQHLEIIEMKFCESLFPLYCIHHFYYYFLFPTKISTFIGADFELNC